MTQQSSRAAQVAAIALALTVVTQLLYVTLGMLEIEPDRQVIWSLEVLDFIVVAVAGLALVPARPLVGAAIATGGMLNTIQAGMGLAMFAPLAESGAVFGAVLAMAFLLYFAGKVAFGIAAVAAGLALLRDAGGGVKMLGGLAVLAGTGAIITNALAIMLEADLTYIAGGAGTLATALLAAALLLLGRRGPSPA